VSIRWLAAAIEDLIALPAYIDAANPDVAASTAERISTAVSGLERFPSIGRGGRIAGTRELIVEGTPCIMPYRLRREAIEVLRVIHNARKWPARF
jgi:toxin ParE1/3/4